MKTRHIVTAVVLLAGLALCGFAWVHFIARPKPTACGYCQRPLHANLQITAEIAGKRADVCCARCAITEANQQRKHLKLITVHDYLTGTAIPPESAWFVEGSRVSACMHDAMPMNEMKETQDLTFDRCSPGTFSFRNKADADAFVARNGGAIRSYAELMQEAHFQ